MAEEQTVSEQQPSSEQQTQTEDQTLDQVYEKFNVEATAQSFQPQREQQPQQQPAQGGPQYQPSLSVPDPVTDSEGYQRFVGQQHEFVQKALQGLQGEVTQLRAERIRAKEEADIKNAVSRFKSTIGEEVDEDWAEVALGQRARKDPKFLAVYQNRDKNPAAWNAAVSALAHEFKSKNQFKIDPNIAEAQRAAKLSTGSQTTEKDDKPSNPLEQRLSGKSGREFDAEWQRIIHQGYN